MCIVTALKQDLSISYWLTIGIGIGWLLVVNG